MFRATIAQFVIIVKLKLFVEKSKSRLIRLPDPDQKLISVIRTGDIVEEPRKRIPISSRNVSVFVVIAKYEVYTEIGWFNIISSRKFKLPDGTNLAKNEENKRDQNL